MARIAPIQRVQDKRWQREIVDPIHMLCDFDLILIMRVDLDQNFHSAGVGILCQLRNHIERFGNHEAAGARLLDGVANSIQTDDPNACVMKLIENSRQVVPASRMANVYVNLLGGECGPEETLNSIVEARSGEW